MGGKNYTSSDKIFFDNNQPYFHTSFIEPVRINWTGYNVQYEFDDLSKTSAVTFIFEDQGEPKYYFTMDNENSEAELYYIKDGEPKLDIENYLVRDSSKVLINATDNLKISIDDTLIFNKEADQITNGEIKLRIDKGLANFKDLLVFRKNPIEVTRLDRIIDFRIDSSAINQKKKAFDLASTETIIVEKNETSFHNVCNKDECNPLREFLNNPQEQFEYQINEHLTEKEIADLLTIQQTELYPSFDVVPVNETSHTPWDEYDLRFNFQTFVKPHSFIFSIDNNFNVIFHNKNVYFFSKDEYNNTIYRRRNPVDVGVNQFRMRSRNNNTVVYINDQPLFNMEKRFTFDHLSFHTKNTFLVWGDVIIENRHEKCKKLTTDTCTKVFKFEEERRVQGHRKKRIALSNPIKLSLGLAAAPFVKLADIFDTEQYNDQGIEQEEDVIVTPSLKQLFEYEIDIDPSLINENIPSEKYVFNGKNAFLQDVQNYSLVVDFFILDGAGLFEVSFSDDKDNILTKFIVNEPKDEIHLFRKVDGTLFKEQIRKEIATGEPYKFEIRVNGNQTSYELNSEKIFSFNDLDINDGYYSISTYSTYMELNQIRLYDRNLNEWIPFSINEDPCKLRKIHETIMIKDSLFLAEDETRNIQEDFSIDQDFDYGLVTVNLGLESGNQSKIHFWVTNNA